MNRTSTDPLGVVYGSYANRGDAYGGLDNLPQTSLVV